MNVTDVVCSVRDEFGSSISKNLILEIPDCLKISESTDVWPIILGILIVLISVCVVYCLIVILRKVTGMGKPTSDDKPVERKLNNADTTGTKRLTQKNLEYWEKYGFIVRGPVTAPVTAPVSVLESC